jgi:hypothetical protein
MKIERAVKLHPKRCTFVVSAKGYGEQKWFACETCGLKENLGKGKELRELLLMSFFSFFLSFSLILSFRVVKFVFAYVMQVTQ